MEEQVISKSTAELAKEVGFNIKNHLVQAWYNPEQKTIEKNKINLSTQSLLQKWIRDKHDIHISISRVYSSQNDLIEFAGYVVYIASPDWGTHYEVNSDKYYSERFDTYEDALEDALYETLKIIQQNKT